MCREYDTVILVGIIADKMSVRYVWHLNALVIIILFTDPFTSFPLAS